MIDDLPLFAVKPAQPAKAEADPALAALDGIVPDELSPKQAMERVRCSGAGEDCGSTKSARKTSQQNSDRGTKTAKAAAEALAAQQTDQGAVGDTGEKA